MSALGLRSIALRNEKSRDGFAPRLPESAATMQLRSLWLAKACLFANVRRLPALRVVASLPIKVKHLLHSFILLNLSLLEV
jgi:hypothetical protein